MIDSLPMLAVALIGAHYLADYPLQGDFLAKAKNYKAPVPGVPWTEAMIAHSAIHGALVALLTGIWWLFVLEFILHFVTDYDKCRGGISYRTDQVLHLTHKACWLMIWSFP